MKKFRELQINKEIIDKLNSLSSINSSFYKNEEIISEFNRLIENIELKSEIADEEIEKNDLEVKTIEQEFFNIEERLIKEESETIKQLTTEYEEKIISIGANRKQNIRDKENERYRQTFDLKKRIKELQEQKQICGEAHLAFLREIDKKYQKAVDELAKESAKIYDELTEQIEKYNSQLSVIDDTQIIEEENINSVLVSLKQTIDEKIDRVHNDYLFKISDIKKEMIERMDNLNEHIKQNEIYKNKRIMDNERQLDLEINQYNVLIEKENEKFKEESLKVLEEFENEISLLDSNITTLRSQQSDLEMSFKDEIKKIDIFKDRKKKKEIDSFFLKNNKRIKKEITDNRDLKIKAENNKNLKIKILETNRDTNIEILRLKIENANKTKELLKRLEDIYDQKRSEDLRFGYETHKETSYCDEKTALLNFNQVKENIYFQYNKKSLETSFSISSIENKNETLKYNINENIKMLEVERLLSQNKTSIKKEFEEIKKKYEIQVEELNYQYKLDLIDVDIETINREISYQTEVFNIAKNLEETLENIEKDVLRKELKNAIANIKNENKKLLNDKNLEGYQSHYDQDVKNVKLILGLSIYIKDECLNYITYFLKHIQNLGIMTFEKYKEQIHDIILLLIELYKINSTRFFNYINKVIGTRLNFEREAKYSKAINDKEADIQSLSASLDYKLNHLIDAYKRKLRDKNVILEDIREKTNRLNFLNQEYNNILEEKVYQIMDRQVRLKRTKEEISIAKNQLKEVKDSLEAYSDIETVQQIEEEKYKELYNQKLKKLETQKALIISKMNSDFKGFTALINKVNSDGQKIANKIDKFKGLDNISLKKVPDLIIDITKLFNDTFDDLKIYNDLAYQEFDRMISVEIENIKEINLDAYQKNQLQIEEITKEIKDNSELSIDEANKLFELKMDNLLKNKKNDLSTIETKKSTLKDNKGSAIENINKTLKIEENNYSNNIMLAEINIDNIISEFLDRISLKEKNYYKCLSKEEANNNLSLINLEKSLAKKIKEIIIEKENYQNLKKQNTTIISNNYQEYLKREKNVLKLLNKQIKDNLINLNKQIAILERKKKQF